MIDKWVWVGLAVGLLLGSSIKAEFTDSALNSDLSVLKMIHSRSFSPDKDLLQLMKRSNIGVDEIFDFVAGKGNHSENLVSEQNEKLVNNIETRSFVDQTHDYLTENHVLSKDNDDDDDELDTEEKMAFLNDTESKSYSAKPVQQALTDSTTVPSQSLSLDKRRLKGLSRMRNKMGGVMRAIGHNAVKMSAKVSQYIKVGLSKVQGGLKMVRSKVSGAIARTKMLYTKVTSNKWVRLMNTTVQTVWSLVPAPAKKWITDKVTNYVVGAVGDIFLGMNEVKFDADALLDDDEIIKVMQNQDDDDYEGYDYESDIREGTFSKLTGSKPKSRNQCCCNMGPSASPEEFDLDIKDFSEDSLKQYNDEVTETLVQKLNKRGVLPVDDTNLAPLKESLTPEKRELVRKRCACARALERREFVEEHVKRQAERQQNASEDLEQPSLLSAVTHAAAVEILTKANLTDWGPVCANLSNPSPTCLSFELVRVGGIAGLLTLKLSCPVCEIRILSAVGSHPNKHLDGWHFILEGTPTLSEFIREVALTYDGDEHFYDRGKNRFTLQKINENQWHWYYLVHL